MLEDKLKMLWSFGAILVIVLTIIFGFEECSSRSRERYTLQKIFVEKCSGTPAQAEKVYPYPSQQ